MSIEPVGRRTSEELTEVRTVLSRAERALERLAWITARGPVDPSNYAIQARLEMVIELLEPYRRTGRPRKVKK